MCQKLKACNKGISRKKINILIYFFLEFMRFIQYSLQVQIKVIFKLDKATVSYSLQTLQSYSEFLKTWSIKIVNTTFLFFLFLMLMQSTITVHHE